MPLDLFNGVQDYTAIKTWHFESPVTALLCSIIGAALIDNYSYV